mgnify:FL=1
MWRRVSSKRRVAGLTAPCAVCAALLLLLAVTPAGAAELQVVQIALHQYEGGPPLPGAHEFFPGESVFLSFRIAGFTLSKEDAIHLAYRIRAVDPDGVPLAEPLVAEIREEVTPQDKESEWLPIVRYDVQAPIGAPTGDYQLLIHVSDELAATKAEAAVRFRVLGRDVEPSDTLVIRNFHFYRTESAPQPLPYPAYRPGDSVWSRFDITGYRFGANNQLHIDYGITVLRASGKVLFEQPVAAEEKRNSFYPQRYIQGAFSLNLTPDLAAGEYAIVVTVRDHIGGQTHEARAVFHVR